MSKKMIDTIILNIPAEKFVCFEADGISKWDLYSKSTGFEKHVKNQTAIQKVDGVYRPRIRLLRRPRMLFMQVEFSIPKLLFKNNVDEVCEKDFDQIISTLQKRLKDFGVSIIRENLINAEVSAFHPSKNFVLKDGYTANGIIKELNKINLTRRMDLTKDTFRNEGQSLQYYTNSHSLVVYDKIKDLKKTKSRAVDKDQTLYQMSLFDVLDKKEPEILRMEVRLSKKAKMKALLRKLEEKEKPNFREAFRKSLCQKIVRHYWEEIILEKNLFLFSLESDPVQSMKRILKNEPEIKPKELVYLVGLGELCRKGEGVRDFRDVIERQCSSRTWGRTSKDLKRLSDMQDLKSCHGWLGQIENGIEEFKPFKMGSLIQMVK